MTTQKAMRMFESLDVKDQKFVYSQMERLHENRKDSRPTVTGLIGMLSLKLASLSRPSKNQYTDDEVDELISDIRHGKA